MMRGRANSLTHFCSPGMFAEPVGWESRGLSQVSQVSQGDGDFDSLLESRGGIGWVIARGDSPADWARSVNLSQWSVVAQGDSPGERSIWSLVIGKRFLLLKKEPQKRYSPYNPTIKQAWLK